MGKERIIIHIDLDYFFAQAEEREHPEHAGKPIIVCVYTDIERGRGVVSTANYAARAFGVRSGMPIFEARKLAQGKGAVFLPGNYELYERLSAGIAEIVARYGDAFEQASIDEFFLDLTVRCDGDYTKAKEIAERIKEDILEKYKLTCSIGIGPNKLVAKIASDFKKPNGLTVVLPERVQEFLDPLPIDKIPGIGRKTREYFEARGIKTVKDLRKIDAAVLVEEFGKSIGNWLYAAAHGIDDSPVGLTEEQKQFSRIKTLKEPSDNLDEIRKELSQLVEDVAAEMKGKGVWCKTVGINAVDIGMRMHTKTKTLSHPTDDPEILLKAIVELYSELLNEVRLPMRRAGVRVENLENTKGQRKLEEF